MCSARELIFLKRKVRSAPRAVHFIFYNKNSTLVSNHYRVFHTNKISRAAIRIGAHEFHSLDSSLCRNQSHVHVT